MTIGEGIKRARTEKGERRISAETLCNIADFLGVSLDYLAGRTVRNDE